MQHLELGEREAEKTAYFLHVKNTFYQRKPGGEGRGKHRMKYKYLPMLILKVNDEQYKIK